MQKHRTPEDGCPYGISANSNLAASLHKPSFGEAALFAIYGIGIPHKSGLPVLEKITKKGIDKIRRKCYDMAEVSCG